VAAIVTLVAFEGSGPVAANSGQYHSEFILNNFNRRPVGANNGNIVIVGGDSDSAGANTISLGSVNSAGTAAATGTISIGTATPTGTGTVTRATGAIATTLAVDTTNVQPASISTDALTTNGASITVLAGQNITTNNSNVSSARASATGAGGGIFLTATSGSLSTGSSNDILSKRH